MVRRFVGAAAAVGIVLATPILSHAQPADYSAVRAMLSGGIDASRSDYARIRTGAVDNYGFYALSPDFLATCARCGPLLSKYEDGGWRLGFHTSAVISKSDLLAFITQNFSGAIPADFKFVGLLSSEGVFGPSSVIVYQWKGPATNVLSISADERRPGLVRINFTIASNPTGAWRP